MDLILFTPFIVSLGITLIALPKWIKKAREIGLLWEDMNKPPNTKKVAASGGIIVVMAFIFGVLTFVAIETFIQEVQLNIVIFALLTVILITSIIGLIDDLLGWKSGGLSARLRVILALAASIPLVVINAGVHNVGLPFMGAQDLWIFYPLIIIPIGIAGATTTYNFLAGFNGLESGQGIIILGFLSVVAYLRGEPWLAIIGLTMVSALIGFYYYNRYPAKVFPGDILTYSVGALIASMAILGNFERIAVLAFIPYIIETLLKVRGKLKKQSFGIPQEDGSLEMPYKKIYGLTHLSIYILEKLKIKATEKRVTYLIFSFQIAVCIVLTLVFWRNLIS